MGKGSGGGSQTVVNKTELPQWAQDAGQKNLAASFDVSQNLMKPYSGERVAGMTNGQQADIAALQNNVGSTNPAFALAQNTAANLQNYTPGQVNAGSLAGTDLSAYMNPYTQNVINSGLQAIDVQRQQALNGIGDQAARTRAFGGSRQGVQEGVTNAAAALQAGNLASQLQSQNFAQAQAAATNDINRNLQAQSANQQAGLAGAGLNLSAANQLGSLASQGQNAFLTGTASALAGQETVQRQNQANIAANQQAYQEAKNYPLEQLQIPLQALGATPYGQTQTQNSTGGSSNGLMTGLGALGTGVGILGGVNSLMGGGTALLTALGWSDRDDKTNIKKLGNDPESGLPMYAYDYKSDVEAAKRDGSPMPPKRVGPMAQDIEKHEKGAVRKIGGHRVVNLGFGG